MIRTPKWRRFDGEVVRVIDGDTVVVRIESRLPGMVIRADVHVRLFGINAPEMNTPEGVASRDWLALRLPNIISIDVSESADKYGRWLGILVDGVTSINDEMLKYGFAKEYL